MVRCHKGCHLQPRQGHGAYLTVEKVGFVKMVSKLDPCYTLPSRNYFAREALPAMYNELRDDVLARLAKVSYYSLTTDMWSSWTCDPYTIHYVEQWKLKSACLQTAYFPKDHMAEHIAEALEEVLLSWDLRRSGLVAVTSDSGSNVVKALKLLDWRRMQCFGYRAPGHW